VVRKTQLILPIRVDQVILSPFGRDFDSLCKRADVLAADTIA
jgi:hypothetical protein